MLIQILFSLQTVTTNRHPVVGGVNNVGVVQLTHFLELLEHLANLNIDIFRARHFAAKLIANRAFITLFPNPAHRYFIAKIRMPVRKGMSRKVIHRQSRLLLIGRRQSILILVIHGPIFL